MYGCHVYILTKLMCLNWITKISIGLVRIKNVFVEVT